MKSLSATHVVEPVGPVLTAKVEQARSRNGARPTPLNNEVRMSNYEHAARRLPILDAAAALREARPAELARRLDANSLPPLGKPRPVRMSKLSGRGDPRS
jgi:hypothetical protein